MEGMLAITSAAIVATNKVLLPEIWYPEKILPEQRRRQP